MNLQFYEDVDLTVGKVEHPRWLVLFDRMILLLFVGALSVGAFVLIWN
jgi:hypothetical protein